MAGLARRDGPTRAHGLSRRHESTRTRRSARRHATPGWQVIVAGARRTTAILRVRHPARACGAGARLVAGSLRLRRSRRATRPRRMGVSGGIVRPGRVCRTRRVGRPRRVCGPRRGSRPSSLRPVLAAPAAWPAGTGTGAGACRGPRAAGGGRRIPRHVEQTARRVDGRGVQHLLLARARRGAAARLTVAAPGTARLAPPVPVPAGRPGALLAGGLTRRGSASGEHEDH